GVEDRADRALPTIEGPVEPAETIPEPAAAAPERPPVPVEHAPLRPRRAVSATRAASEEARVPPRRPADKNATAQELPKPKPTAEAPNPELSATGAAAPGESASPPSDAPLSAKAPLIAPETSEVLSTRDGEAEAEPGVAEIIAVVNSPETESPSDRVSPPADRRAEGPADEIAAALGDLDSDEGAEPESKPGSRSLFESDAEADEAESEIDRSATARSGDSAESLVRDAVTSPEDVTVP